MNAREGTLLPDVQAMADERALRIDRVGIRGLRHPVKVRMGGGEQASVAMVDMAVALPPEVKGTHMSRFLEVLNAHPSALSAEALPALLRDVLGRLEADSAMLAFRMPVFLSKCAPVSRVESLMDYDLHLSIEGSAEHALIGVEVGVPVTSLCPCSREISDYGAHNQRSLVRIAVQSPEPVTPESLIAMAEQAASCELFGLLKRVDEKHVTERAYDNPRFVEDLVREVAWRLNRIDELEYFSVSSENFESIHNHSAYALIEGGRRRG